VVGTKSCCNLSEARVATFLKHVLQPFLSMCCNLSEARVTTFLKHVLQVSLFRSELVNNQQLVSNTSFQSRARKNKNNAFLVNFKGFVDVCINKSSAYLTRLFKEKIF